MNLVERYVMSKNTIHFFCDNTVINEKDLRNIIDSRPITTIAEDADLSLSRLPDFGGLVVNDTSPSHGLSFGTIDLSAASTTIAGMDYAYGDTVTATFAEAQYVTLQPAIMPNDIVVSRACVVRFDDGTVIRATGVRIEFEN